jgi:hypothetical protein
MIHGASPEQWQLFAFVFAALAMVVTALLDALPPWNSIIVRVSRDLVDALPWMSREWPR